MWSRKRKERDVTNKSFRGQIGIYDYERRWRLLSYECLGGLKHSPLPRSPT